MIQIRGLRKKLNDKWVLDGLDLDIHEGMSLVIMGPSGTGKSVLLKHIVGLSVELTGETSYDRLVGTCYLPDGRDIGAEIVKAGLALDGGHFSEGKYRHLEEAGVRQLLKNYGRWR